MSRTTLVVIVTLLTSLLSTAVAEAGSDPTKDLKQKLEKKISKLEKKTGKKEQLIEQLEWKLTALLADLEAEEDPTVAATLEAKILKTGAKITKAANKVVDLEQKVGLLNEKIAWLDAPFGYSSMIDQEVVIEVRDSFGDPIPFVRVLLADPLDMPSKESKLESRIVGREFVVGLTNSEGRFSGTARIPSNCPEVDVVLHRAGFKGPYADEALRAFAGPFAASSRNRFVRSDLNTIQITLTHKSENAQ